MDNIRIAKELVKLAKSIVASGDQKFGECKVVEQNNGENVFLNMSLWSKPNADEKYLKTILNDIEKENNGFEKAIDDAQDLDIPGAQKSWEHVGESFRRSIRLKNPEDKKNILGILKKVLTITDEKGKEIHV